MSSSTGKPKERTKDSSDRTICPVCLSPMAKNNIEDHITKLHFPIHKSNKNVKKLRDQLIDGVKKNKDLSKQWITDVDKFWKSLWANKMTDDEKNKKRKCEEFYGQLIDGEKESVLYIHTQLLDGYEKKLNHELPKVIFRYVGKHADITTPFRHFFPTGSASGNVSRGIRKAIISFLKNKKNDVEPQEKDKIYGWYALEVPKKSLETVEHCVLMAMFHLTNRDPSIFWNQRLDGIPKYKKLRDCKSKDLLMLGVYIVYSIIRKFRQQVENKKFFKSNELLATYNGLKEEKREKFNNKYGIDEENASQQFANEIIKLQKQFYENVCIKAKQKQDADLLELCNQFKNSVSVLDTDVHYKLFT